MDAERLFRRYIDLLNKQKWSQLFHLISPTISYNHVRMSGHSYIHQIKDDVESSAIASLRLDMIVKDQESNNLAARVIVTARTATKPSEQEETTLPSCEGLVEYPRHYICVTADGMLSEVWEITDTDAAERGLAHVDPSPGPLPIQAAEPSADLAQFYAAYIKCINDQTMETDLHNYCQPHVIWGDRRLSIDEYRGLMKASLEAIPGLVFNVRRLVADAGRQQLCARIEFKGTPVKSYAGAEPNGRPVEFAEHVFYWLDNGKIARVVTVIDWQSYRRQLSR
jgi:predicted ester cyclase